MGELDQEGFDSAALGFETRAIHAGQEPDAASGAVVPPISLSTTFAQTAVGEHLGYEYARSGNPTRTALETCLASLEGAEHGFAFASGLSAEDALLRTLVRPGQRILLGQRRVRRHVSTDLQGARTRRHHVERRRPHRPARARHVVAGRRGARVARDADEPAADLHRHRGDRDGRASARRAVRRRQHVRHPLPAATARARRRRRRPLVDEVPRRPLGCGGRLRGGRRRGDRRADAVRPERGGRGAEPVRLLPGAARSQDVGRPHGAPLRERASDRRPPRRPSQGRSGAVPTAARPSGPRSGSEADARLRRDGVVHVRGRRGSRARGRAPHAAVHAGRVARSGRVAHRAPWPDDARVRGGLAVAGRRRARCDSRSGSSQRQISSRTLRTPSTRSEGPCSKYVRSSSSSACEVRK